MSDVPQDTIPSTSLSPADLQNIYNTFLLDLSDLEKKVFGQLKELEASIAARKAQEIRSTINGLDPSLPSS